MGYKEEILKKIESLRQFEKLRLSNREEAFKVKNLINVREDLLHVKEFLNYLIYSETFFCDSFHGICLSVILKKQFYVYLRNDGKKIIDICERLGLSDRIVNKTICDLNIDYEMIYRNLDKERRIAFDYLDKCFGNQ